MFCPLNYYQDITARENKKMKSSRLPFEELIMDNGDLSTKSEYDNRSNINFPLHYDLNQVDFYTDLLGKVILTEVVLPPSEKPRILGLDKLI